MPFYFHGIPLSPPSLSRLQSRVSTGGTDAVILITQRPLEIQKMYNGQGPRGIST